jgi:hypothetical protein
MCRRYSDAIQYYSLASLMNMSDPIPTFHTAECLVQLGLPDDARQALGFVLKQCKPELHDDLKERANSLLSLLGASKISQEVTQS